MSVVGKNIQTIREARGYSQNALAKKAGIAQATISAIEKETKSPSVDTVILIANALCVPVADLIGEAAKPDGLTGQEINLIMDFRTLSAQGKEYVLQSMALAVRSYAGERAAVPVLETAVDQ